MENDQSNENFDVENKIVYKTEVSRSNLCEDNNSYTLVRGEIIIKMKLG